MSSIRVLGTAPLTPNWTDRLERRHWRGWARLEGTLRADPKWKTDQVDSISNESMRVLRHLPDPRSNGRFQGRGLVVGYVQSGKTANYTAVAARAVDAGYRMIIVLSGIHDALRNQTQTRLERELVGIGALTDEGGHYWKSLTGVTEDFRPPEYGVLDHAGPFLIVAKKIVPILERLDQWLSSAGERVHWLPTLLIDDEADQASINTRGFRKNEIMVSEEEETSSSTRPSATNALIRSILGRLPKASYVAYTATPFANIFIDPQAFDPRVGADLFPRDFAIQLPKPEGYTGTEELFGVAAQGRDVLRMVPNEDVVRLRATRRRRPSEITLQQRDNPVPPSLTDALLTFCLAGAVRELRSAEQLEGHTMLVHVSQLIRDQARIADSLRNQLDLWRHALRQGDDLSSLFRGMLAAHLAGVELPSSEAEVIKRAEQVLRQLVVLELNSTTGENLEYEDHPGRHIVAVGGNRLSRGLTLEGLTISYFLRTTSMSDTLLQMARWYGFRTGYEDLIRIWTTDGIARWFSELALVEESLRDALITMSRAGRRPDQMAIRLRAHSELLLTARNKSGMADEIQNTWSGEHPQTVLLPLANLRMLQQNRDLTDVFVRAVGPNFSLQGGLLAQDVPAAAVAGYLRAYGTHDDIVAFRADKLADWILTSAHAGELTDWSVFLAGSGAGVSVTIGDRQIGLVRRSRVSSESIGILIDPRHEGVDLALGPDAYRRAGGAYDSEAMRMARPSTQALLIIYPLDPSLLGVVGTDAVIALGLSFPRTADVARTWIINRGVVDA